MEIQDIKTPGFLTEPRLMGEQNDNDGTGKIHYSAETLVEVSNANYYMSAKGDLYYREDDQHWFKYDKGSKSYETCTPPPFKTSN